MERIKRDVSAGTTTIVPKDEQRQISEHDDIDFDFDVDLEKLDLTYAAGEPRIF